MAIPISPSTLVGAVRATIDIVNAGRAAAAQYVRDRDHLIPDANVAAILTMSDEQSVNLTFRDDAEARMVFEGHPDRLVAWDKFLRQDFSDLDILLQAQREYLISREYGGLSPVLIEQLAFGQRVRQWAKDDPDRPLEAWERFAVSLADVTLGFVGSNPALLGIGGNGEKLIGAFASSVAELIPDDGKFGPRQRFGERLLGAILQAGLETVSSKPDLVFTEKHLQQLVTNIATPVLETFDSKQNFADQTNWQAAVDALLGPAVSAAFTTVADNQQAFLGRRFATEEAIGALTHSLLTTASTRPPDELFSKEGMLAFYSASLGVVATRPDLFLGKPKSDRDKFFNDLLGRTATVLAGHQDGLNGELGVAIAVSALDSLKAHAPILVNVTSDANWERVFDRALVQVITGLRQAAGTGSIDAILTPTQITELARIVLEEVAKTPRMAAGGSEEVQAIVAAMARAMAADDKLLLSGDDWRQIVAAAATEAAANPGRLFGFSPDTPGGHIAEKAIHQILEIAGAELPSSRQTGAVLFGGTLKHAIETTLKTMAGNVAGARTALDGDHLKLLIGQLNKAVATKSAQGDFNYGAREWLATYRFMLSRTLASGTVDILVGDNGALSATGKALIDRVLTGRD